MTPKPTIECKPNGPYAVKGLTELRNSAGEPIAIPVTPQIFLCRCGGSANKPFCDSTHRRNGFSGERLSDGSADRVDAYQGLGITILDNRSICSHAGRCSDGLAAVFKYKSEPWIDAQAGSVEEIIETVNRCPSGALSYSIAGAERPEAQREPRVTVSKDGPYEIVGAIELVGVARANGASTEHYTLCRCGASKNKPFCDGSHWAVAFKDEKN